MITTTLIQSHHLTRKAIIYIRQSSPHQVLSNQESLRLQYALNQRAQQLGWAPEQIRVIDADLGVTGASTHQREGYKEVLDLVTRGQVGILLSYEVQRLSRNCTDWYPLLDICAYKGCLIGDNDGIYDPASTNGRLLLGLKGQLSELELHTIRSRMTAGLLNKAHRGELALRLPIGLTRTPQGQVIKTPHQEVQGRIELVFQLFEQSRTANQVLRQLNQEQLLLPRQNRFGNLIWKKPTIAMVLQFLKNPAYAGAFVYGKTRTQRDPRSGQVSVQRLPIEEWKICIRDKYPAYITWQRFEKNQAILKDNHAEYDRNKTRGIPRPGKALLHGLVYCGECGHKLVVQYKGGTRYLCTYLRGQYQVPVCQHIPADPIDDQVVNYFFRALSPVELDAYEQLRTTQQTLDNRITQAHQQQLERFRYEAGLAQRQFDQVDPDNRLVAAELETRWEGALQRLQQAEEHLVEQTQVNRLPAIPDQLQKAFNTIGQSLPALWQQDLLAPQHKKALLRCLIDKVIVHRSAPDTIQTRIVWKGGETTSFFVPVPVGSLKELSTDVAEMERIILDLSRQGSTDEAIAEHLTALGHRSPMQPNFVLPSTVRTIRLKHGIFQKRSQSHPRRIPGFLTPPQIARALDISPHWIYDRIHNGTIHITKDKKTRLYLFPDQPDTLNQFRLLKQGILKNLRFSMEYQDA